MNDNDNDDYDDNDDDDYDDDKDADNGDNLKLLTFDMTKLF